MIKNSFWSFSSTIGMQLIGLIGNIILARLLYPQLFGLLGMATIFSGLILVIQEAGFSSYIIYKKDLHKEYVTTSFWINIFVSVLLSSVLYILSGMISDFFNENGLKSIIILLCIGMIFSSLGITSRAVLTRKKEFDKLAIIDLISQLSSTIISIIFAFFHFYYLAITSRFLVLPFIQTTLLLFLNYKLVIGRFNSNTFKEIIPYSCRVLGTNVFIYFNNNLDYFMIGKYLGSRQLGLYTIAFQWSVLARFYLSGAVNKVLFPEISRINYDLRKVRYRFLKVINALSFFTFPLCFGLMGIADEFVRVLYGDLWEEAITTLQILLIAGAITSIGTLSGALFQGLGKPEIEFRFNIVSFSTNFVFIYIGVRYSIEGVAVSILINTVLLEVYKTKLLIFLTKIKIKEYLSAFLPNFFSSLIMFVEVLFVKKMLDGIFSELTTMIILIAVGTVSYLFFSLAVNRKQFIYIYNTTRGFIKKTSKKQKI